MTTLDDLNAGPRGIVGLVSSIAERLRPVSRRSVLVGAAVAGSALATKPKEYVLRPVAAYSTICGPGNTAASGWTAFCCTINRGVNACPPGSFAAGWWKAADSSWCGAGYRYIVDCNASCSKCTTGCSSHLCDRRCWSCSCGSGSTATCDQRRVCCNAFRYGQCNTQIRCSGGVHCRVVSCIPPYRWTNCTTTSLQDNRTSQHSAPCLPRWDAISLKYRAMGEQGSYLKASTGSQQLVGDGRGTFVNYQGGAIYSTAATGAHPIATVARAPWVAAGGPRGQLGYPRYDWAGALVNSGWVQIFEHGAIADSASTTPQVVWQPMWSTWAADGRERGHLGYPSAPRASTTPGGWIQLFQKGAIANTTTTPARVVFGDSFSAWKGAGRETGVLGYPSAAQTPTPGGWIQLFQKGATCDSSATTPQFVYGDSFTAWKATGRETGALGFPSTGRTATTNSGFVQLFQRGAIAGSAATPAVCVSGVMYPAWVGAGRESGVLGYPAAEATAQTRGRAQTFQTGELWALGTGAAHTVYGGVLTEWQAAGGADGSYGYPVTDTRPTAAGGLTCTFENGTITT